jgi:hypothetical protein
MAPKALSVKLSKASKWPALDYECLLGGLMAPKLEVWIGKRSVSWTNMQLTYLVSLLGALELAGFLRFPTQPYESVSRRSLPVVFLC